MKRCLKKNIKIKNKKFEIQKTVLKTTVRGKQNVFIVKFFLSK